MLISKSAVRYTFTNITKAIYTEKLNTTVFVRKLKTLENLQYSTKMLINCFIK